MAPEVRSERTLLFDKILRALRVVGDRFNLASVADDALVLDQALDVAFREPRDAVEVELMKRRAEVVALGQNSALAQSGLKALQAELLK
jgi:hypothetical protein